MSQNLKKLVKAATRTVTLITLAEGSLEHEAVRTHMSDVRNDLTQIVESINKRTLLTASDEIIFTEFLTGVIQGALSLLCSDGSLGCTVSL